MTLEEASKKYHEVIDGISLLNICTVFIFRANSSDDGYVVGYYDGYILETWKLSGIKRPQRWEHPDNINIFMGSPRVFPLEKHTEMMPDISLEEMEAAQDFIEGLK